MKNDFLTNEEKQTIKVLNFIAKYDGVLTEDEEIKFLLNEGIEKFIAPKRQHLVSISRTSYPIRIVLLK